MPLIKDLTYRWDLWYAIFSVLPIIIKKDKDDAEHTLFSMFSEFKNQIQDAKMMEIIKLGNCLTLSEKKIVNVLQNKVSSAFFSSKKQLQMFFFLICTYSKNMKFEAGRFAKFNSFKLSFYFLYFFQLVRKLLCFV